MLIDVAAWGDYRLLGTTRDDAAGEAFDKVGKLLGLPYPGGRHVEALALTGVPGRYPFTRPMLRQNQRPGDADYFDVSFSGIKTAVLHAVEQGTRELAGRDPARHASGHRARISGRGHRDARRQDHAGRHGIRPQPDRRSGAASRATARFAAALSREAATTGATVYAPTPRLATDNAAMIARAGLFRLARGDVGTLDLNAFASAGLPGLRAA